jgi:hypothetical protein
MTGNKTERMGWKRSWPILRYYPSTYMHEEREEVQQVSVPRFEDGTHSEYEILATLGPRSTVLSEGRRQTPDDFMGTSEP